MQICLLKIFFIFFLIILLIGENEKYKIIDNINQIKK